VTIGCRDEHLPGGLCSIWKDGLSMIDLERQPAHPGALPSASHPAALLSAAAWATAPPHTVQSPNDPTAPLPPR